jgi:hypothetical protein
MPKRTFSRALSRVSAMWKGRHQAQPSGIHGAAVLGGDLASDLPVGGERVEAGGFGRSDAQHAEIAAAGQPAARWRHGAGDRDLRKRIAVGKKVQVGLLQRVPVGLLDDDLAAGKQGTPGTIA